MNLEELRERITLWKEGRLPAETGGNQGGYASVTEGGRGSYHPVQAVSPSEVAVPSADVPVQEMWTDGSEVASDGYGQGQPGVTEQADFTEPDEYADLFDDPPLDQAGPGPDHDMRYASQGRLIQPQQAFNQTVQGYPQIDQGAVAGWPVTMPPRDDQGGQGSQG
jgi:hypothetical protein